MVGGWVSCHTQNWTGSDIVSLSWMFNVLCLIVDALTTSAVLHWFTFIDGVRLSLSLFIDIVCWFPTSVGDNGRPNLSFWLSTLRGLNPWSRKIWSSLSLNEGEKFIDVYLFMGSRSQWARLDPQSRSFSFTALTATRAVPAGNDEGRSGPRPWAQPRLLARKCAQ